MSESVSSVFELEDRVSKQLKEMASLAQNLDKSFKSVEVSGTKAFNPRYVRETAAGAEAVAASTKESSRNMNGMAHSAQSAAGGMNACANGAGNFAKNLAKGAGVLFGIREVIRGMVGFSNFSDDTAMLNSRLLLATDSTMTLAEAQDLVMQKAKETKADYTLLAETVGKIGVAASDAFKNTKEAVDFASALNQAYLVGGASGEEIAGSTRQLTQALASGVLRGDELNSVMEGAPLVAEAISKKLGITKGEIRKLAADGKLSADIVKEAVLENADEINKKFQKMNGTLGGTIKNGLKNSLVEAFREPAAALNHLFNSEGFAFAGAGAVSAINMFAGALTFVINLTDRGLTFMKDNWDVLGGVIKWTSILVGGVWVGKHLAANWAIIKSLVSLIRYEAAVGFASAKAAAKSAIAWGIANWPFLVVMGSLAALAIYFAKTGVTAEGVAGVVGGAFASMGAAGKNVAVFLTKVFGFFFDWQMRKAKAMLFLTEKVASAVSGKKVRFEAAHKAIDFGDNVSKKIQQLEFVSVTDAYAGGSKRGKEIFNSLKSFVDPRANEKGSADYGGAIGKLNKEDEKADKVAKIKDNTDSIKKSMSDGIENLNYLMKSALSQRVTIINNDNKLDIKNEFINPDSSFDIDGLGTLLGNSFLDSVNSGSGGVPSLA